MQRMIVYSMTVLQAKSIPMRRTQSDKRYHPTPLCGEVRRALSGAKGRNQRTYGLGGAPVVIVHGHQRYVLAEMEQRQAVEPA